MPVFEGLTQYFEDGARKFGKFVEEEDTVVCQGYLSRHGVSTSSDHGDGRDSVMGRAEWPHGHEVRSTTQFSGHGVYFRRLKRLGESKRWQYGGQSLGHHALT